MAKGKWKEIETRYAKPVSQVLIEVYQQRQSVREVALELGVTAATINMWMLVAGLEIVERRELVKREVAS